MKSLEVASGTTTTPTTGFATIYNSDDTHISQRNWITVAAAQVQGSLPAPAKITIKNLSGGSRNFGPTYIGNYVFNDPTTLDPYFRHEDASVVDTTPSSVEGDSYAWELFGNNISNNFMGQFGRFVVVWSDRPAATTLIRAAIRYGSSSPPNIDLAMGEQMLNSTSDYVTDLGALPILPGGFTGSLGDNVYFTVRSKTPSGGDTLGIDWLQIFPSGAGLYRVLKTAYSFGLANNEMVIDDGPEGSTYTYDGSLPLPLIRPLFSPIHLWPGRINLVRFIISGGAFSFEPDQAWGIKAEMRYRRLSF